VLTNVEKDLTAIQETIKLKGIQPNAALEMVNKAV